jgi:PAS domain S-box-containing protein
MVTLPYDISGIALLYVEDEADARGMVSRMLVMNYPDLQLYTAENGVTGLESYREHLPEIVMTDINMPVMDGLRMSREIKAINPEVLIIAVTAHSDTSYLLHAIEIGIHQYVLKPINYDQLFGAIDKILEQITLKRLVEKQNRRISESERQLAVAQRIAHLGSWQLDLPGGAMLWSDELFRIFGLEPASIPTSYESFLEWMRPEDRAALAGIVEEAVWERTPLGAHHYSGVRPDGSTRVVRVEGELVLDGAGQAVSVIGTCLDVTELKRAEEEVRSLTEDLERRVIQRTSLLQASLRELESFSYVVSHDLRAPVARLEGFCRALLEDCGSCVNPNCMVYAERAERVVRQIKSIIDAFNELSHYARCRMVVEEVDLGALARKIFRGFAESEPEREVAFFVEGEFAVQGDRSLLLIALEHLLGNAWKFTSKTPRARITFGSLEQDGRAVYFVRDNGAGFDMKYVAKLFKPFQTIHSPGEYSWNGTAIGLATVHSIILRHGGRVWAEGTVGGGATFYFTLGKDPEPGSYLDGPGRDNHV